MRWSRRRAAWASPPTSHPHSHPHSGRGELLEDVAAPNRNGCITSLQADLLDGWSVVQNVGRSAGLGGSRSICTAIRRQAFATVNRVVRWKWGDIGKGFRWLLTDLPELDISATNPSRGAPPDPQSLLPRVPLQDGDHVRRRLGNQKASGPHVFCFERG